jgi:hypothetical protein
VITAYMAGVLKPIEYVDEGDPYKLSNEERGLLALLSAEASAPTQKKTRRKKAA